VVNDHFMLIVILGFAVWTVVNVAFVLRSTNSIDQRLKRVETLLKRQQRREEG
jgi:hypothetical protein